MIRHCCLTLAVTLVASSLAIANPPRDASSAVAPHRSDIGVAVLDFEASSTFEATLGGDVAEAVRASLSGHAGVTLVERAALAKIIQEHELNQSGLVDGAAALKIGKLTGAQLLITGRIARIGKSTQLTARIIGTETTRLEMARQEALTEDDLSAAVLRLSDQVATILKEKKNSLMPAVDSAADSLAALRASLAGRKLPVLAVVIRENHITPRAEQIPDPAVETEVKRMLKDCGFTVRDIAGNPFAEWADSLRNSGSQPWPRELEGVDYVVIGEAFSELGTRVGRLASCSGRAELNLIARSRGTIELADRTTARGIDLAENVAGKRALEKCGQTLGQRLIEHLSKDILKSN